MTPLPAFSDLRRSGEGLSLAFDIDGSHAVFEGHFQATPILAAVAQVDWAIRVARDHFPLPRHFNALRSLKFLRVVQPPVRLTLELSPTDDGRGITFTYAHGGTPCSSGRIEFSDDAPGPDRSVL